jgi:hypothetical protein
MENNKPIPIANFCLHHEVEMSFVLALQKFGLIEIFELEERQYFAIEEVRKVEKMARLHQDLGINLEGIHAVISLLKQIEQLQKELMNAQNRLDEFTKKDIIT